MTQFYNITWTILAESAGWIIISLLVAGLLHEFLETSGIKKLLNRPGLSATASAVLLGAMLPICSCGVIPIAVGLFRSGVRLGPVMAFTAATPIINPAAVILSLALLGPRITMVYVTLGLVIPFILGYLCERFGGVTVRQEIAESAETQAVPDRCCSIETTSGVRSVQSFWQRSLRGLRWGFFDLGPTIGFYLLIGIMIAGFIQIFLPAQWMTQYLGDASVLSLIIAAVLGASLYVCAVAHIPLVATMLAAGAGPGVAIVFLVTGTATNLPELITLYKTLGRRTVILYTSVLVVASIVAGLLINRWLGPDFEPYVDPLASLNLMNHSDIVWLSLSVSANIFSAYVVTALAGYGVFLRFHSAYLKSQLQSERE